MMQNSFTPPHTAPKTPSVRRRMACWLYEGVLLFGVVFLSNYFFSALTQTRHALDNRHASMLFLFMVLGVYFVWFWHKGHTLAMKTWHIAVRNAVGAKPDYKQAIVRYLWSWLWFLPPLILAYAVVVSAAPEQLGKAQELLLISGMLLTWIGFYAGVSKYLPEQQFLHDVLAKTRLVEINLQ